MRPRRKAEALEGHFVLTSILSVSRFAPPDFLLGIVATVLASTSGPAPAMRERRARRQAPSEEIVRHVTSPAVGANVKFKRGADGAEPYSRISDVDGRFELKGAAPGKYKVGASLAGATQSDEQEVSVVDGSDHEIEIVIKSAAPTPQPTPQTGTVQGTVTKPDGTPAPQASVVLAQGGTEKVKKTTDADGKYKIEAVAVGDYSVDASLDSFNPSDKATVKVTAGGQHTAGLKLKSK